MLKAASSACNPKTAKGSNWLRAICSAKYEPLSLTAVKPVDIVTASNEDERLGER